MRFAYEYIKKIIETTSLDAPVLSVVAADGKTTIGVIELQHIAVGRVVAIDGVKHLVESVNYDDSTFTVSGEIIEPKTITYPEINFVHGTAAMVNAEIQARKAVGNKSNLDEKQRYPLLWMVEVYTQKTGGKTDNFDVESDIKLVLLDDVKSDKYTVDQHYVNVIHGQKQLWDWLLSIFTKHKTIVKNENFDISSSINERAHTNFGRFQDDKGHTTKILDANVSGLEIELSNVRFKLNQCKQAFETVRCIPITIYQTIMAGGIQRVTLLTDLNTKSIDDNVYYCIEKKRFYVAVPDGGGYAIDNDYITAAVGPSAVWAWIDIAEKSNGFFIAADTTERDALPTSLRRKGHVCSLFTVDKYVLYTYQGADGTNANWQNAANWTLLEGGGGSDADVQLTKDYAELAVTQDKKQIDFNTAVDERFATIREDLSEKQIIESALFQNFDQATEISPKTGDLWHNGDEGTLSYQLADGGSIEMGEEVFDFYVNVDSVELVNKTPVSVYQISGNRCAVKRTDPNDEKSARAFAGLVTVPSIPINQSGRVTKIGRVKKIDTIGLTEGLDVYVTGLGQLGNTIPSLPSFKIRVGTTEISHAVNGQINLLPQITEPCYDREKTGFVYPESVVVTGNGTNRTVTLTGQTLALFCGNQTAALTSGWTSAAHPSDNTKSYFLYYDGTNFVWSETVWQFYHVQITKAIYLNGKWRYVRESHGLMPHMVHKELHEKVKAYLTKNTGLVTGFVVGSTAATDRRPVVSQSLLNDEDLPTIIAAITTNSYTRCWLTGSGDGVANFAVASSEITALSGNQPYYNQFTGGSWQQTLLANNQHTCIWLVNMPMAADADSQEMRTIFMLGQSVGTLDQMRAKTPNDLNINALKVANEETVIFAKLIIKYVGSNWQIADAVTYYNNSDSPSGGTTATTGLAAVAFSGLHIDLTGLNNDTNNVHILQLDKEDLYKALFIVSDLNSNTNKFTLPYAFSIDTATATSGTATIKYDSNSNDYVLGTTITDNTTMRIVGSVLDAKILITFSRR